MSDPLHADRPLVKCTLCKPVQSPRHRLWGRLRRVESGPAPRLKVIMLLLQTAYKNTLGPMQANVKYTKALQVL